MGPKDILKRPYHRVLIPDEETATFTAMIQEFPGCIAQGDTAAEAYQTLEDTAEGWLESVIESGMAVPDPLDEPEYSGRVVLRMPRSTHRDASQTAEREGVSLNTFLVAAVAEKLGHQRSMADPAQSSIGRRQVSYAVRERRK